ncbi:MAG: 2-C-methyl-D-erythritol 4-phosphate cytidylyltransferase [Clostridiaceae bacterium]|nr:2-C-methyl-D-erythritol 4-phosphate cytidylyltransferase [Clostridiaceae bacterium]
MMEKKRCTAIVLAAGQGKRMGTKTQKQYLNLCGYPVLWHCLHTFEESAVIDDIILVTGENQIDYCRTEFVEKYGFRKICKIVAGGAERYHSVLNGLRAMEKNACEDGYVFIHDGARPFVDEPMLERVYADVCKYEACVVGMPVKDTIKIADTDGFIKETPKRCLVWQIQTPQVFSASLICYAYEELGRREKELLDRGIQITDDAMVVEEICGRKVRLTEGSYENMKLTTPEDLEIAETFLRRKNR